MTYTFAASPSGTHFYHSHAGLEYGDGLAGAFVVRDPADPYEFVDETNEVADVVADTVLAALVFAS